MKEIKKEREGESREKRQRKIDEDIQRKKEEGE